VSDGQMKQSGTGYHCLHLRLYFHLQFAFSLRAGRVSDGQMMQ